MNYKEASIQAAEYRKQIAELRKKMRETRAGAEPEEVRNYEFSTPDGKVRLLDLFGGKSDLMMIHNMGTTCPACTMWADGFNGVYPHLKDRAAFVVSSPDSPAHQRQFASSRGWRFPMVSHEGTSFAADMGYRGEGGGWQPGISVFRRDGARALRVSDTRFGPFDDFCSVWHFLDLLPEGAGSWHPKFSYG
jgi:predicted dithiol-disulfide oxidoreductase (DUF899 family)